MIEILTDTKKVYIDFYFSNMNLNYVYKFFNIQSRMLPGIQPYYFTDINELYEKELHYLTEIQCFSMSNEINKNTLYPDLILTNKGESYLRELLINNIEE